MFSNLVLPVMCAPMSFASSVALTDACCRAGVIGGWQGGTATPIALFTRYLDTLAALPASAAPAVVNIPARVETIRDGAEKLALLERHRVPLVLCSAGNPGELVKRVHDWGGRIIQDVTTLRHAEKALAGGVDGLMATCAGAGGHTGFLTPFAFVPAIRRCWDGLLIVAGGIAEARGVAGVLALGGDIACMGTRFIATPESGVVDGHRRMIVEAGMDRIIISAAMNGVPANWMRDSIEAAGFAADRLPATKIDMPEGIRPWRDIWSAGHSVAMIDAVEPVAALVARMADDLSRLPAASGWQIRLADLKLEPNKAPHPWSRG